MTAPRVLSFSPARESVSSDAAARGFVAMQILDSLDVVPVWVEKQHLVQSAIFLMEGHGLGAIAVLEDGRPIGLLRRETGYRQPLDTIVGAAMEPLSEVLDASASLREAADLLVRTDRQYAPVVKEARFQGMITAMHLLDGLRRSWDAMTDLPWSDELRRWGAEMLDGGHEIAVIFVDLDRFGGFNKRFGHVVGDRVLRRVADLLRDQTDPRRDILVRYGGDEFAIGTLRPHDEAEALAAELQAASREARLTEGGEPISFSVGIYGGNRGTRRDESHVQATLDDLINLASRRSIAAKPDGPTTTFAAVALPEPELFDAARAERGDEGSAVFGIAPAAPGPAPQVIEVQVEDDPESLVHVVLRTNEGVSVGVGLRMGRPVPDAVASATARALERVTPDRKIRVDGVVLAEDRATVLGTVTEGEHSIPVTASTEGPTDDPHAIAEATVRAFWIAFPSA